MGEFRDLDTVDLYGVWRGVEDKLGKWKMDYEMSNI